MKQGEATRSDAFFFFLLVEGQFIQRVFIDLSPDKFIHLPAGMLMYDFQCDKGYRDVRSLPPRWLSDLLVIILKFQTGLIIQGL
jgi:hypothetical protein